MHSTQFYIKNFLIVSIYVLYAGGRQCTQKSSIMVATETSIEEFSIDGTDKKVLFKGNYKLTGGFDVDVTNNSVYWSSTSGNIYYFKSGGNFVIHNGVGIPRNILINWITRRLYWINNNELTCSDLDGKNFQILIKTKGRLLAIALNPHVNYIYWCSYDSQSGAVIEKMKLDGTNRKVIISENLRRPTSMSIDYAKEKLYWADSGNGVIESTDLEGGERSTVCHIKSRLATIALYDNIIYWTNATSVHRCTTDGNNLGELITTNSIKGIVIKGACKLIVLRHVLLLE